jgi:hypothetical protein
MNPTQDVFAPLQHLWSDGLAIATETMDASRESAKRAMESAFSLAAATAKEQMNYGSALAGHLSAASSHASAFVREQAALAAELPKDPMGTAQRMLAGYLDSCKQSMAIGTEALKSCATIGGQAWAQMEKASQDSRQIYTEYAGKLQDIVEAKIKNG